MSPFHHVSIDATEVNTDDIGSWDDSHHRLCGGGFRGDLSLGAHIRNSTHVPSEAMLSELQNVNKTLTGLSSGI